MITRLTRTTTEAPASVVRIVRLNGREVNRTFQGTFCIGRDESCEVMVESGMASRRHAEVELVGDTWRIRDLQSTNGTFLDGKRVEDAGLTGRHVVKLGADGPELELSVDAQPGKSRSAGGKTIIGSPPKPEPRDATPAREISDDASVTSYINRYFADSGDDAGEHTQMIRQAYRRVSTVNRRKQKRLLIAAASVVFLALAYTGFQQWRVGRLEARAQDAFQTLKELDVQTAKLQAYVEERGDATLAEQLEDLKELRQRARLQYEGYVDELGLQRRLTEEERAIYRV
ncbi:MAG TPA: FHA domain-containing protein, partial [Rhodothermales bacterium]